MRKEERSGLHSTRPTPQDGLERGRIPGTVTMIVPAANIRRARHAAWLSANSFTCTSHRTLSITPSVRTTITPTFSGEETQKQEDFIICPRPHSCGGRSHDDKLAPESTSPAHHNSDRLQEGSAKYRNIKPQHIQHKTELNRYNIFEN